MSRSRWRAVSALIVAALASLPRTAETAPAPSLEYSIKATFLYKFAPFVQWPASAFESPASPVSICILGSDGVSEALEQTTITETVGERPYEIRRLTRLDRDIDCHILYIAGSGPPSAGQSVEATRGAPVLTVTDSSATPQTAGIVNFVVEQNRVRFDIDDAAAAQNGLSISSRLLDLARFVRRRP